MDYIKDKIQLGLKTGRDQTLSILAIELSSQPKRSTKSTTHMKSSYSEHFSFFPLLNKPSLGASVTIFFPASIFTNKVYPEYNM